MLVSGIDVLELCVTLSYGAGVGIGNEPERYTPYCNMFNRTGRPVHDLEEEEALRLG